MPEPPRRKRFPLFPIRWHLSTAIVLMFVAGGLIWENLHSRPISIITVDPDGNRHNLNTSFYGWPYQFTVTKFDWFLFRYVWWGAAIDLFVILVALGGTYFIRECLLRRTAQKEP